MKKPLIFTMPIQTSSIFIFLHAGSLLFSLLWSPFTLGSPLIDAVRDGHYDLVKPLIEQGTPVDQVDNPRTPTALITVIMKNEAKVAKYLIEQGANVNAIHPATQCSALQLAAGSMNNKNPLSIVKLLVSNGADINRSGKYCGPAIMEATIAGHLDIVQYLFEHQADLNLQKDSSYALYEAVLNGHQKLAQWLLEQGANPNLKTKDGSTAVHIIAQYMPNLFTTVVAKGGQLILDNHKRSVLSYAIFGNNQKIVAILLNQPLSQEALDDALRTATTTQNEALVRKLVKKGANPKARDPWGENALSISEAQKNENIQKSLKRTVSLPW